MALNQSARIRRYPTAAAPRLSPQKPALSAENPNIYAV